LWKKTAENWEICILIQIVVPGDTDLPQIVGTLRPRCGLADLLYSWEKKTDKESDNCQYYNKLDQGQA
jgi:hypothetical protein